MIKQILQRLPMVKPEHEHALKRAYLLLLLIVLLFIGGAFIWLLARVTDEPVSVKQYNASSYGLRFQYPSSWSIMEQAANDPDNSLVNGSIQIAVGSIKGSITILSKNVVNGLRQVLPPGSETTGEKIKYAHVEAIKLTVAVPTYVVYGQSLIYVFQGTEGVIQPLLATVTVD
ncbi:MAG: hypothetical protein V1707_00230 [bacterium]